MLWLALHFSQLPLEALAQGIAPEGPLAVSDGPVRRPTLVACNTPSLALGVRPGMGVNAALALVPKLGILIRRSHQEAAALTRIAAWAGQFTPHVSLAEPFTILLEVAGSLSLFGGRHRLVTKVREGLKALGYSPRLAIAPTPLGAELLARSGLECHAIDLEDLCEALSQVDILCLPLPEQVRNGLEGLGLRSVRECLSLPRAGLARRFGNEVLDCLDRLTGRRPDPRPAFVPPPSFSVHLTLPAEVSSHEGLLFACRRLLLELCGALRAQQSGIQHLKLVLGHHGLPPTSVPLDLAAPSRDSQHLLGLLRIRLERIPLPGPVQALRLRAGRFSPLPEAKGALFPEHSQSPEEEAQSLLERLRARLGAEAVQGIQSFPDHRPEHAWRLCVPGEEVGIDQGPLRPLWLLKKPLALKAAETGPCLDGNLLTLKQGPERIESGWWDGHDAVRDYYVAESSQGTRLWVFQERGRIGGWFLHGVFG